MGPWTAVGKKKIAQPSRAALDNDLRWACCSVRGVIMIPTEWRFAGVHPWAYIVYRAGVGARAIGEIFSRVRKR